MAKVAGDITNGWVVPNQGARNVGAQPILELARKLHARHRVDPESLKSRFIIEVRNRASKPMPKPGGQPLLNLNDGEPALSVLFACARFSHDNVTPQDLVLRKAENAFAAWPLQAGRVVLSQASPDSVNIKFVTDEGVRSLLKNKREAMVTVPGKLTYEAQIGFVVNKQRRSKTRHVLRAASGDIHVHALRVRRQDFFSLLLSKRAQSFTDT